MSFHHNWDTPDYLSLEKPEEHDLQQEPARITGIPRTTLLILYEMMLRIRRVEEVIAEVYAEQEMRCPTHLSIGQEAAAAGMIAALRPDDSIFSTHRCHAHYIAKGGSLHRMLAELYGKATGCAGGKGGSMHLADESAGMVGTSAIVGASIPLAMGAALAFTMQKSDRVAVAFFGDAGTEQGIFHETMNFSALRRLPVIFFCENNFYATQSPLSHRQALDNIYRRGEIYGIPGNRVDGNDVLAVYEAGCEAVARARGGGGPTLIECRTYRWREHVGPHYDWDMGYRSREEVEAWMEKCPVKSWREYLLSAGYVTGDELQKIAAKIESEIADALALARTDPFPGADKLYTEVY
jgi:acetoin:2,6-dichlorophenolindophenol oxidoreductase subunit alpha